jgi:phosphoglycerate dehydrogenase-like enzyme
MPATPARKAPRVLVIERFATDYERHIRQAFPHVDVVIAHDARHVPVPLHTVDVLVAFGIAINDDLMRGMGNLAWIQSLATGVDHFLKSPHLSPGTLLTSARGIHGAPMRETVALLMLGVTRDVHRLVRHQQNRIWERGEPWPLLAGKSALVLGSGVSGSAIGNLLKAFGMTTIVATRSPRAIDGFDRVVHFDDIAAATAEVDFLIDVLPGGPEYAGLVSRAVIAAMKPSAIFINVGRGETVDEPAMIEALQSGRIAGAGLDVVARTPLSQDSPLWSLPNVLVSPHIGGYFREYEAHMMPILIENMRLYLAGQGSRMRNLIPH